MSTLNLLLAIYIGAILGGFATVLVPRLAALQTAPGPLSGFRRAFATISAPGSSCACGRTLTILEKAPVPGWALARGRCRACGSRISAAYPLSELAVCALMVLLTANAIGLAPGAFALEALIPASFILIAMMLLPVATLATYVTGLAVAGYLWFFSGAEILTPTILLAALLILDRTKWRHSSLAHAMAGLSVAFLCEGLASPFEWAPLVAGIATILLLDLPRYFGIPETSKVQTQG